MFTFMVLLALAFGIGATTTVFSLVQVTLLERLPYADPGRVVSIWTERLDSRGEWQTDMISPPEYFDLRDGAATLENVALHVTANMSLRGLGNPMDLGVGEGTAELAVVLGISPLLGRWFLPGEVGPDRHNVTVLGESFWREQFGSDPGVIGRTITLEDQPYTVVGVVPSVFRLRPDLPYRTRSLLRPRDEGERPLWVPLGHNYGVGDGLFSNRDATWFEAIGRLHPGASVEQAQAEAATLVRGDTPAERLRVVVKRRKELETAGLPSQLLVLALPSVLLLLIACGNVATLLLGEGVNRRVEIATRVAIGAGSRRIARQLLTESLLLGLLGSVAGALVAFGGMRVLVAFAPATSAVQRLDVNGTVLLFSCAAGIVAALVFGLVPAWFLGRQPAGSAVNQFRGSSTSQTRRVVGTVVALEIALTVVVLVGGGLFTRTLAKMFSVDLGFDVKNLVAIRTAIDKWPYPERGLTNQRILDRIEAVPGVEQATGSWAMPFVTSLWNDDVQIEGRAYREGDLLPRVPYDLVMPDYHEVMRVPLLAGRYLSETDGPESPRVVLVSESTARRLWPDRSALGERLRFGRDSLWHTVVGIVGDVVFTGLDRGASSPIYRAYMQSPSENGIRFVLIARTALDPRDVIPQLEEAARSVEPGLLIEEASVLSTAISLSATDHRYAALMLDFFAAAAIMLAAIGVVGVTARSVAQRTRELAIRLALGAESASLNRLVLRGSLLPALVGVTFGLLCAFWASRLISGFLFGVQSWDPLTYGVAVSLVLVVCLAASYLPARRALGAVQPAQVLKEE
jgi:predicted permease